MNEKFLNACGEWLPADTTFVFQTDQEFLFNETKEELVNTPYEIVEIFESSAHGIPTHWEKQKLLEGDKIWRMRFRCR